MVFKISCTNIFKQHYIYASAIQEINWFWCGYEWILSKKINARYLLLEWVEFVLEVWEKSRNYFLWTLWQPCNYIHYNEWDEVTYPSSKFKYENQVWESSLRIGRISRPNIESEYRVRISRPNIASEYRAWKLNPKTESLKFWNG